MYSGDEHNTLKDINDQKHLIESRESFVKRVAIVAGIAILTILLLLFLLGTLNLLPLLFLSILIAVSLRGMANQIQKHTPFGHNVSLLIVLIGIMSAIGVAGVTLGPSISGQTTQFTETIPRSIEDLRVQLSDTEWGQWIIAQVEQVSTQDLPLESSDMFSRLTGVFSSTLGGLTNAFIILFIGVYLAVEPSIYIDNMVRLFPKERRPRMREIFDAVKDKLRDWILARLGSMIVVGILTTI